MSEPTIQEIQARQGTRNDEIAPWMSYAAEMGDHMDPKLAQEVADYAQRRHDAKPSEQSKEELHRQREYSQEVAEQYQFIKPEEYEYLAPRLANPMHPHLLITKLRKTGLKCWYTEHPHKDKAVLVVHRNPWSEPEVGCWVQYGVMPEYSVMRFDDYGVPLDERRRGWRTVLLQLIIKGLITEDVAHKHFGTATGPASERYLQTLHAFRNREDR